MPSSTLAGRRPARACRRARGPPARAPGAARRWFRGRAGSGSAARFDRRAQLEREIAPTARQRRQSRADAPRGGGRRGRAHRVRRPPAPRRGRGPGRRGRRRVGLRPRPARGPCRPSVPTTSPVRVSAVVADQRATPKSVSFAGAPPGRPLGHQHVAGLDVAVDDAARVRVGERVGERDADLERCRGPTARPRASSAPVWCRATSSETS